uniref:hypothetical protein n=1 Tax=Paractinoplanes polyasparticus TaxID=2856853 RepID=UPI001C86372B|nr:hypothetical protein [Actinoplanes polyasparticus]
MTDLIIPSKLRDAHAITLKNPWAHLIAHYGKDVENRSWMPWDGVHTLLIHAGKGWDRGPATAECIGEPHTSAIVAVADLSFACDTSRHSDTVRCGCGEWAMPGQCHWRLTNVRALRSPVPANGRQGLWQPTSQTLAEVAEAVRS